MKRIFFLLFIQILASNTSRAQFDMEEMLNQSWVDSVFESLTPDQRIAQLIWVNAEADDQVDWQLRVADLIQKYDLGGVIFFTGDPDLQVRLTNLYQSVARTPLFIAMDAEWGVGMRLPGVMSFPYNMMMGASGNPELIRQTASEMVRQMKRLGVQVSLGPVADINTQPLNPIIGMRSFGESPERVTDCSMAYMQGLQKEHILAVAKHFPGHGDTRQDSHLTLPQVPYSRERLDSVELAPFRALTRAGIAGIMTAHLNVPALDPQNGIPASLSAKIINGILRNEWNYQGLVVTDAMNMGGARSYGKPGELEVKALKAGNDIVEFPKDVEVTIQAIKRALDNKELSWDEINQKCRRVLAAKLWAGLDHLKPADPHHLMDDLNAPHTELVKRKVIEASLTLLENHDQIIPLMGLDTLKVAILSVGEETLTPFQKMLAKYTKTDDFHLPGGFTESDLDKLKDQLKDYNVIIAGIHLYESKTRRSMQVGNLQRVRPLRPYGMSDQLESLLSYLGQQKKAIEVFFSSPYALTEIRDFYRPDGLILAYQNDSLVQELSAQMIFGGIGASGRLPVSLGKYDKTGDGISIDGSIRMKYTIPEEAGMNSTRLTSRIDSIVHNALEAQAIPGCSVLAAKDGKIIFHKTYGYHTYDHIIPVSENDLYDLASVTKVSGALPAIMKLTDEEKIDPDEKFSTYWPDWEGHLFHPSNKKDLTYRAILAHQAGLLPYLNFWQETMKNGRLEKKWYAVQPEGGYQLEVAPGLYLNDKFKRRMYRDIRRSALTEQGKYVYSGLSFLIVPELVQRLSGKPFTEFLDENFYHPLGAYSLTYKPLDKFSPDRIVPTEYDNYYRKQLVHGTVHDEAAADLGGISGNAGLFATANDLAKLIEMYMQMGSYGGKQYLSEQTMHEFTKVQFPENNNRRGMGFDKPLQDNHEVPAKDSYPCPGASAESFGHSGFTGTFVWADPSYHLTYIFLSNRVYPTRENNKLTELNVRTGILQVLYDEISDSLTSNTNNVIR